MNHLLREMTAAYLAYLHEHGYRAAVVMAFPDREHSCTIANFGRDGVIALLQSEAESLASDPAIPQTILVEISNPNEVDPNVS